MRAGSLATFIVLGAALANGVSAVTPVQKVLEMMAEMKAKGIKSMEEEQKVFKEYGEWVDDESWKLETSIKTAKAEIAELTAFIEESSNKIEELGAAIKELEAEIAALEADMKKATAIRDTEKSEYLVVSADYQESLDAIDRAIQVLEAQPTSVAQAEMLLQRMAVTTRGMRRVLAAFLQERSETERGGPAVAAYKSSSGGVIEMLEGLQAKFKEELSAVNEQEANKLHAYELEMLHLKNTVDDLTADVEEKSAAKAKLTADVGAAQAEKADTEAGLKEDEDMLAEVKSTYMIKTEAYEGNQKVRKDEIAAIEKAIEIISSPEVAGVALAQTGASNRVSLLQTSSAARRAAVKDQAVALLRQRATTLSSKALTSLAEQLEGNPFAKVVTMIKELLQKLKEEAAAEAEHKAWCDEELKKNKLKRDKLTIEQKTLLAEIEVLASSIETMGAKIKTLIEEQAELTKAMADATEQREKEKAANQATIADCAAAIPAVKKAITILSEFYASQEALLQQKGAQVPEMAAYKGQGAASGGVVGMLEVILSDFTRTEADTTAEEKQAQAEYEKFMADAEADKKSKHKEEFELKLAKDDAEFKKSQKEKELAVVEKELAQAVKYFGVLKPTCLEVHVSYEQRVKERQAEIDALNEAYGILDKM